MTAQPANATYILAVGISPDVDPNNRVVSVATATAQVILNSAKVVGSQVQFTYTPIGTPGPFTIALYQSASPTLDLPDDVLVTSQNETPLLAAATTDTFIAGFTPDPTRPYLLVVINPQSYSQSPLPTLQPSQILPAYLVTETQLVQIMTSLTEKKTRKTQLSAADASRYIAPLNEAMEEFSINTPKREAAFLSQVAVESKLLTKWTETFPSKANLRKGYHLPGNKRPPLTKTLPDAAAWFEYWYGVNPNYEQPAKGLDNTEPGDGAKFYGRGPIQITGRGIYQDADDRLNLDLIIDPDLVSDNINNPEVGFRTSAYWWTVFKASNRLHGKNLTQWADSVNPQVASSVKQAGTMISRIVTGASKDNGSFHDRLDYYSIALDTLNM